MPRITHDLCVTVGSYADATGTQKNRYRNVGAIMRFDDGGELLLLNRDFNPAGVPFKAGSDRIVVSKFEKKDGVQGGGAAPPAQRATTQPAYVGPDDDDIPF